jgi:radical SAM protein with 4Fe4S-binding SPASM domain
VLNVLEYLNFDTGIQTNLVSTLFDKSGRATSNGNFILKFNRIGTSIDINRIAFLEKILSNVAILIKYKKQICFMVTITHDTDFYTFSQIITEIEKLYNKTEKVFFRLVLEHPWDDKRNFVDIDLFKNIFDYVVKLRSFDLNVISSDVCGMKSCSPIYGGNCLFDGVRVISPAGEIFFCPDNLDNKDFRIGDIFNGENFNFRFLDLYVKHRSSVYKYCSCKKCFGMCKGGCFQVAFLNYKRNAELFDYYCNQRIHKILFFLLFYNNLLNDKKNPILMKKNINVFFGLFQESQNEKYHFQKIRRIV